MPGMDGFETCRQIRMLPVVRRHAGAVPDRARRPGHAQAGAGLGGGRLPDQADQPDRAPDPRPLVAPDQADVRRAEAELRRHPRAARRAAGREPTEGRADRADRPRSQEPAVQHPVERAVRAEPQGAGHRGERFAGGRPARVAVDGAAGDEPAGRVAQRGWRADPARDPVRAPDAAAEVCKEMGRRVEDKDQRLELDGRRRRPRPCAAIAISSGACSRT